MSFGKVDDRFWTDEKIRSYSDAGKLLANYLLTNSHRTLIGCYRLPMEYICADLQWTADKAAMALSEVCGGDKPFAMRDQTGWTLIVNFLRYEKFTSPNHYKAADFHLSRTPKISPLFPVLCRALSDIWKDDWCRRPKVLEATSEYLNGYSEVAPKLLLTPAPAPAPAPAPVQNHKNGSGADAPSLKSRLFGECLDWMTKTNGGKDPAKYRTMIGKWISVYGEPLVIDAFLKAQRGDPAGDPIGYVTSILRGTNGKRPNPDEQLSPGSAAARIFAEARSRSGAGGHANDD